MSTERHHRDAQHSLDFQLGSDEPMSAGLFALLDDVAVLARLAAASVDDVGAAAGRASAKAAGVVIDDTAVTPQYVHGLAAERELPIIKRIAVGSLRNKMLFILPVALVLSQFLPWLLTPILMLGGAYLCFEAAEKIWGAIRGHGGHGADEGAAKTENEVVSGAVRTDLILSAEIMVISLNEVAAEGFWSRLIILTVVAVAITVVVYGVVALIVKMDDMGVYLAQRSTGFSNRVGRAMVSSMPRVLTVISIVGTAAMLWVGGHIELVGLDELGWHAPYELVHHLEEDVHHAVPALGGVLAWLTNTAASALLGLVIGAMLVAVAHLLPFGHKSKETAAH
uniref:Putative membrane protein n=1 Tax=uncultured Nocardioidaceae bacterium TaxID=253824 RepID=A0A6J4MHN6_9ACTN|nr:MAG: putative membrane protein [uncultured Nocardioidaceae bacterium]